MKRMQLREREERRLMRGHLWVFRNEVAALPALTDGELVDIYTGGGRFIGRAFAQATGGIAARILSRHQDTIDASFLKDRLTTARTLRERLFPGESVYRWVHGESDGLPGLMADRYGSVVSMDTQCAFYANRADELAEAFLSWDDITGLRLAHPGGVHIVGEVPEPVAVTLDGLPLEVALSSGQKTGMYLDQRVNCRVLDVLAPGARVFDGHCYAGLWACVAARAGAAEVLGVDTSQPAIERARRNAAINDLGAVCRFECADAEEILSRESPFDVVCIDPPPLARGREHRSKALGRYQALNAAAIQAVAPGGYLVTSCCSHAVGREGFMEAIKRALRTARREAQLLEVRGAAADHPVLPVMAETDYLVCAVLRIMG